MEALVFTLIIFVCMGLATYSIKRPIIGIINLIPTLSVVVVGASSFSSDPLMQLFAYCAGLYCVILPILAYVYS